MTAKLTIRRCHGRRSFLGSLDRLSSALRLLRPGLLSPVLHFLHSGFSCLHVVHRARKPTRWPRPPKGEGEAARNNVVMSGGKHSCPDLSCYSEESQSSGVATVAWTASPPSALRLLRPALEPTGSLCAAHGLWSLKEWIKTTGRQQQRQQTSIALRASVSALRLGRL